MGNICSVGLFQQMLRSATPVALAGMGGLMTEHAGIMNIGMDGMILMGAFAAVAVSVATGSAFLGLLAAILVGMLVGLFFALFVVKFKSDEFIIGTALNILADGLTVFLLWAMFNVRGTLRTDAGLPTVDLALIEQIPFVGQILSGNSLFVYLTWGLVFAMFCLVYKTPWGFWVRAAGEKPGTLRTAGISPDKVKWASSVLCGAFCGLAGMVEVYGTYYRVLEGITTSFGFTAMLIALLAKLNPIAVVLGSLFISMLTVGANSMQISLNVPTSIVNVIQSLIIIFILIMPGIEKNIRTRREKAAHGKEA